MNNGGVTVSSSTFQRVVLMAAAAICLSYLAIVGALIFQSVTHDGEVTTALQNIGVWSLMILAVMLIGHQAVAQIAARFGIPLPPLPVVAPDPTPAASAAPDAPASSAPGGVA